MRNVDEVIIDGSTFTSNIAKAVGGAIVIDNSRTVIIRNCHFEGNLAEYHGGAVSINGVSVETTLVRSSYINNTATHGSSMMLKEAANLTIDDNSFSNNRHDEGATIFWLYLDVVDTTKIAMLPR